MPDNSERASGTSLKGKVSLINRKQPDAEVPQTRRTRNVLKDFSEVILVVRNFIIWIHPSERRDNENDEYFVGCKMDKTKKLDAFGRYRSTLFNKNDWIIKIWWYDIFHE